MATPKNINCEICNGEASVRFFDIMPNSEYTHGFCRACRGHYYGPRETPTWWTAEEWEKWINSEEEDLNK